MTAPNAEERSSQAKPANYAPNFQYVALFQDVASDLKRSTP